MRSHRQVYEPGTLEVPVITPIHLHSGNGISKIFNAEIGSMRVIMHNARPESRKPIIIYRGTSVEYSVHLP